MTYGYEAIDKSNHIDKRHKYAGYVWFVLCMASWHYACTTSPGNITSRTMALFDHYEYDNLLYTERECPTLKIRKIARSKYDRCTNRHGEFGFGFRDSWEDSKIVSSYPRFLIFFKSRGLTITVAGSIKVRRCDEYCMK